MKVILSCVSLEDVMTAHRDTYGLDDATDPPEGEEDSSLSIIDTLIVQDRPLLEKSLNKMHIGFYGFLPLSSLDIIREMIKRINELSTLIGHDDSKLLSASDAIEHAEFIVPQESVSAFDAHDVRAYETVTGAPGSSLVCRQLLPMTRVFELIRRPAADFPPDLTHKELLIFNKGYGYVTSLFEEMFLEFELIVHNNFPAFPLAEEMLWYHLDRLKDQRSAIGAAMSKIRVFFDCAEEEAESDALNLQSVAATCKPPVLQQPCGSVRIRDIHSELSQQAADTAMIGTAPAFEVSPSPCRDAFSTGINLWNSDTRKESRGVVAESDNVMIIREFVNTSCYRVRGSKVKSSKLYATYKDFHKIRKPKEKALSHAQFSTLMKQTSLFETQRASDGQYWKDLMVANDQANVERSVPLTGHVVPAAGQGVLLRHTHT